MRRVFFAVAWLSIVVGARPPAAQDPWARVPAFPTTCYADDGFGDRLRQIHETVAADFDKQAAINTQLKQKMGAIDIMVLAQKMQSFLMKDPAKAAEVMQAVQGAGTQVTDALEAWQPEFTRVDEALNDHIAKFKAAVEAAHRPTQAEIKRMIDKAEHGHADAFWFNSATDEARYVALVARLASDYDKLCGAWWGANGTFAGWLRDYRTLIINDVIPALDKMHETSTTQFAIMEIPAKDYRSTATLEWVRNYLAKATTVYALRPNRFPGPMHMAKPKP